MNGTVWFVNIPGRMTWQTLKNETHVCTYFLYEKYAHTWVSLYVGTNHFERRTKDNGI